MKLTDMSEAEFRTYIRESGRRIGAIAEAEGHPIVALATKDGSWTLYDMDTGKEWYGKA